MNFFDDEQYNDIVKVRNRGQSVGNKSLTFTESKI